MKSALSEFSMYRFLGEKCSRCLSCRPFIILRLVLILLLVGCGYLPFGSRPTLDLTIEFFIADDKGLVRQGRILCGYPNGDGDMIRSFAQTRGPASAWAFSDAWAMVSRTPICATLTNRSLSKSCQCSGRVCITVDERPVCRADDYVPVLAKSVWENEEVLKSMFRGLNPPQNSIRLRWPDQDRIFIDHFNTARLPQVIWSLIDDRGEAHSCGSGTLDLPAVLDELEPRELSLLIPVDIDKADSGLDCQWKAGRLTIGPALLANTHAIRLRSAVPFNPVLSAPGSLAVIQLEVQAVLKN